MHNWREPGTLEQLPRDVAAYYASMFAGSPYDYEDTGRKDAIGGRVYARFLNGEPLGFIAVLPYQAYVARVKDAARRGRSVGIPRTYAAVDPETGLAWGESATARHKTRANPWMQALTAWIRAHGGEAVAHAKPKTARVFMFNSRQSAQVAHAALRQAGWDAELDTDVVFIHTKPRTRS